MKLSDFRFVHFAFENHFAHIGNGGNGRPGIKVVALNHRVSNLNRHGKHHPFDGGADDGVGCLPCLFGNALAGNLKIILGSSYRLLGCFKRYLVGLELGSSYNFLVEQ